MNVHSNVRSNFVPLARILRSVRYVHKWMFISTLDIRLMVHGPETFKRIKTISQTWMYVVAYLDAIGFLQEPQAVYFPVPVAAVCSINRELYASHRWKTEALHGP